MYLTKFWACKWRGGTIPNSIKHSKATSTFLCFYRLRSNESRTRTAGLESVQGVAPPPNEQTGNLAQEGILLEKLIPRVFGSAVFCKMDGFVGGPRALKCGNQLNVLLEVDRYNQAMPTSHEEELEQVFELGSLPLITTRSVSIHDPVFPVLRLA